MNVHLLFKDRDFERNQKLPWNEKALIQDLELNTLFQAMSDGDDFLFEVVKSVILSGVNGNLETIAYRQDILRDCLKNPSVVKDLYFISIDTLEKERKNFWSIFRKAPEYSLNRSIEVMQMFVVMLKKIRSIADQQADKFDSNGFSSLLSLLKRELTDEYFSRVQDHLAGLKFADGFLISAELGKGNKGSGYVLHKYRRVKRGWLKKFIYGYLFPEVETNKQNWLSRLSGRKTPDYTFHISSRDDSGIRALRDIKDEAINLVANALAQSNDHILEFFRSLRTELAFYLGCLKLYDKVLRMGEPVSFPHPLDDGSRNQNFIGLYDVCLALTMNKKVVGNNLRFDNKQFVIVTGANQGGKSTFLRSIGLSQLMMQCGMFVPADSFSTAICDSLFTHFKREEDAAFKSGKLEEELGRMSEIIDRLTPHSILLFNESFAATNEREGSEIAKQIVSALLDIGARIYFVTHQYEFAHVFFNKKMDKIIFLRAERQVDGTRSFKLIEGEPLETSYGVDLYNEVFECN